MNDDSLLLPLTSLQKQTMLLILLGQFAYQKEFCNSYGIQTIQDLKYFF